jgi:hypothetical protein
MLPGEKAKSAQGHKPTWDLTTTVSGQKGTLDGARRTSDLLPRAEVWRVQSIRNRRRDFGCESQGFRWSRQT